MKNEELNSPLFVERVEVVEGVEEPPFIIFHSSFFIIHF